MDVHVPQALTEQLRRGSVDVISAKEDGTEENSDAELLERSSELGRIIFTQDIRFRILAEDWQRSGKPFAGLIFGHQLRGTIGQYVRDLELIAKVTDPEEWEGRVEQLPF